MSDFEINVDWAAPPREYGPPYLQPTFANVTMNVNGKNPIEWVSTEVERCNPNGVLYRPMHGIGYHMACVWYAMLYDPNSDPVDLAGQRNGWAFPSIRIKPRKSTIGIEWDKQTLRYSNTRFVTEGDETLPRYEVEKGLVLFCEKLHRRLKKKGFDKTPFQDLWLGIDHPYRLHLKRAMIPS